MWFFVHVARRGQHRTVPGMFANLNAGDPTKWTYVADHDAAGRRAPRAFGTTLAAPDHPGHAAQQVQPLLGRADAVPGRRVAGLDRATAAANRTPTRSSPAHRGRRRRRSARPRAGNRRVSATLRYSACSRSRGVADDQQAAPRGRRWAPTAAGMGRRPMPGQSDARPHSGHRAVRGRLRGQRQHREPDLPLGRTGRTNWQALEHLARVGCRT